MQGAASLCYFQFYIRNRTPDTVYWLSQSLPLNSIFQYNCCHSQCLLWSAGIDLYTYMLFYYLHPFSDELLQLGNYTGNSNNTCFHRCPNFYLQILKEENDLIVLRHRAAVRWVRNMDCAHGFSCSENLVLLLSTPWLHLL